MLGVVMWVLSMVCIVVLIMEYCVEMSSRYCMVSYVAVIYYKLMIINICDNIY